MNWQTFLPWFGGASSDSAQLPSACLDEERLRSAVARERLRCDRTQRRLALAIFDFAAAENSGPELARLAEIMVARLRQTDDVGRWSASELAALLPDTDAAGAWKVVDDLLARYGAEHPRPEVRVYEYPSPPTDSDAEESGPQEKSLPTAAPLEALFAQPLPLWKRGLDVVGAAFGLVLLSPLLLATAIAVWATSPGPILFLQRRQGLGGKNFTLCKFRTMYVDAEERKATLLALNEQDGPAFKIQNDPRITPIGTFLRKSCIDELPQLWNVLWGEMTLVGPRPLEFKEQRHVLPWQRRRLEVTPGLTCIWQVDGGKRVSFAEWMRMDRQYMESSSLWQDLVLIARTALKVVLFRAST